MCLVIVLVLVMLGGGNAILHDYGDALAKSILYYEGQRSGKLPPTQRVTWRKDSALCDGRDKGVSVILPLFLFGTEIKKKLC